MIRPEGRRRLHFLRNERIRAGNNKEFNEQMQMIVKEVDELVSEKEQMQTYNAEAVKRLAYSAIPTYLFQTLGEDVKMLTHRLVADRKEILENRNDFRIYSFIAGIKELIEVAATQVSISDNLRLARELQQLIR